MKNVLTCLFAFVFTSHLFAQDPLFTQKTGNINHFNPALVGAQSDFGVQANYNNQWPSLPGDYTNYSILTNYNLKNGIGFGLDLGREDAYYIRKHHLKVNTNYSKIFGQIETRYGLSLGLGQNTIDLNRLRFEDQIDPGTGFINPTAEPFVSDPQNYFMLDIGAAGYYKGFLLGLGVQQVNQPNTSVFASSTPKYSSRIVGNIGYIHRFDDFFQLAALSTFQHQGVFTTLENQVFCQYHFFKLGLGNRMNFGEYGDADFFSASLGAQFNRFSFGYSHENTPFNDSRQSLGGTHQATVAWYIKGLNREKGMSRLMNVLM